MRKIDLNVDCGESFGHWVLGNDAELLRHVSSASVACGGHAGDPMVMRHTVRLCKEHGVAIGAHPGYPDPMFFGRRVMLLKPDEVYAIVLVQIGALFAITRAEKTELCHVKPHGALFNVASEDMGTAEAIARAVADFSKDLMLVGLAGSRLLEAGVEAGLRVVPEAYADRAYERDGRLRSRNEADSLIEDNLQALAQILNVVKHGYLVAHDGTRHPVKAESMCIHGDTPGAPARAAYIRHGLSAAGIRVEAPAAN